MNGFDIAVLCSIVFVMGFSCGVIVISHNKKWIPNKNIKEIKEENEKYNDIFFEEEETKWEKFKKSFKNIFVL